MKCCCINRDFQQFFNPSAVEKRLQVKFGEFSMAEKNISGMLGHYSALFLLANKLIYFEDLFTVEYHSYINFLGFFSNRKLILNFWFWVEPSLSNQTSANHPSK